ncbi:MAG TPA: Do family serine endopeptidase [Bryobacteraceae bacterium]|nr:Do family serine endopeptidase [Bryobacteraceae bacterium]
MLRIPRSAALLLAIGVGGLVGSLSTGHLRQSSFPTALAATAAREPSFENGFAPIAEAALAAVVNISSAKIVRTPDVTPFLWDFFGDQFQRDLRQPRERRERSLGSGVLVRPDGYLLTNNHVVSGATEIKVSLSDKRELTARVVGADPKTDIALLKLDGGNFPVLAFGDSSKVRVGEFALAVGDPFGVGKTVTLGIVSAVGRGNLGIEDYEDFIQTDAAINPGNSGGALIDAHGKLIGINTAIVSGGSGGNQGVGFAVPVNMARQVMDRILKDGRVVRGWLGVSIQPVTQAVARSFGLSKAEGALVGDVTAGSPAEKSGIQRGDIILAMDGEPIAETRTLSFGVAMKSPGTSVMLKVFRDHREISIPVKLAEQSAAPAEAPGGDASASRATRGLSLEELTPQIRRQFNLPARSTGVVVVDVEAGSAAAEAGLRRGDVIQEVNRKVVTSVPQFEDAVRRGGNEPVMLLINRGGSTQFVVLESR